MKTLARLRPLRLTGPRGSVLSRRCLQTSRATSIDWARDGTASARVRVPFVEALRNQKSSIETAAPAPARERDLSPRKMSASRHSFILPLVQDPWLLDTYINANGQLRLGTLFMDLDALAGMVAYNHTGDSVMTVTAAADRIQIRNALNEICDLELSGQVTFATGRSSMEVSLQVAKVPAKGATAQPEDILLTSAFTMVSLDPTTKKPVAIPPLQVDTPEEQHLFDLGQKHYEAKKAMAKTALRKVIPNEEESQLIHDMWLRGLGAQPANTVGMASTRSQASQIMQPQYRNRHNFMIFGGYLLKQTFELAFCCAAAFSHARPVFLSLDPSTFENSVPVGSVLSLTARVAYTEPAGTNGEQTRVQVRVDSRVRNVEHREVKDAGQFNYTFLVDGEIRVMPQSYSEFMVWTEARRRAEQVNESIREEQEMSLIS